MAVVERTRSRGRMEISLSKELIAGIQLRMTMKRSYSLRNDSI